MAELLVVEVAPNELNLNRDVLTGEPGSHPVGTTAGAASGGIAGAAVGMALAGPVGGVIGAAIGAVAGGISGNSAAEAVNPTIEESYWRESYLHEPFFVPGHDYEYYEPGFRSGWEGRVQHDGRSFEAAEADLAAQYNRTKTNFQPDWSHMRPAALAAWNRVHNVWGKAV